MSEAETALSPGSVIDTDHAEEPLSVIAVSELGGMLQVHAEGLHSRRGYSFLLNPADIGKTVRVASRERAADLGAAASHFRLALEARRIRLAYEFDPHFAVGVSRIDPLPHQLVAVYHYLLQQPRIRFLLADDPGAGKTIMAGLLLKELKYRRMVARTLIVTPANLTVQWQRELWEKFGETFYIIDRGRLGPTFGRSEWEDRHQCITSIDFAKQDYVKDALRGVDWDLIIIDEAHKLAAYQYPSKVEETGRYKLGRLLAEQAGHLLFLTATPHKGDPNNFLLLLRLLDPDLFATTDLLREAVERKENPIFLRRLKEDMKTFDRRPLFPPREVATMGYELAGPEMDLYREVTTYVQTRFQRAQSERSRNVTLGLIVLQRRLASSTRAIRRSLERLKERREEQLRTPSPSAPVRAPRLSEELGRLPELMEELEDLEEEERWKAEEEAAQASLARTPEELEAEIHELDRLIDLAKRVEASQTERKLDELRRVIEDERIQEEETKLLIFTEHRDTLDYLVEQLQRWGLSVTMIHGQMPLGDPRTLRPGTRLWAEEQFRGPAQVMVATEAAGEGINLQFCHLMINYDIPWNPNRLDQRMGRIHRYGQTHKVHVYNLVATNTLEGRVLRRLLEKLETMRQHLGSDRVFDVISDVLQAKDIRLDELIRRVVAGEVTAEEAEAEIDRKIDPKDLSLVREASLEMLATRELNLQEVKEEDRVSREQRLMPEYIERFFVEAFQALGGRVEARRDRSWHIEHVPIAIRQVPPELERRFGRVEREYRRITFYQKSSAPDGGPVFMGPGHPLFEATVHHVLERFGPALRQGAVFQDADAREESLLWFVEGGVVDGRGQSVGQRLFCIRERPDGALEPTGPQVLHDLKAPDSPEAVPSSAQDKVSDQKHVLDWAVQPILTPYFQEMRDRRSHELEIRQRYVEMSGNYLIDESNRKLADYYQRAEAGQDMSMPILNEERRLEELRQRRDDRLRELAVERGLNMAVPMVVGAAAVVPLPERIHPHTLRRDDEVEALAMAASMQYERDHNREPEDVSLENLGFDIRSRDGERWLYIEVKGQSRVEDVLLTPNEKAKAERFGPDYWLYIVTAVRDTPKVTPIQDPARNLHLVEEHMTVRYRVKATDWQAAGAQ